MSFAGTSTRYMDPPKTKLEIPQKIVENNKAKIPMELTYPNRQRNTGQSSRYLKNQKSTLLIDSNTKRQEHQEK